MNIWRVRETLANINKFKHFLLVISRNKAFDVLKKQLKEQKLKQIWGKENMSALLIAEDDTEVDRIPLWTRPLIVYRHAERKCTYPVVKNGLFTKKLPTGSVYPKNLSNPI